MSGGQSVTSVHRVMNVSCYVGRGKGRYHIFTTVIQRKSHDLSRNTTDLSSFPMENITSKSFSFLILFTLLVVYVWYSFYVWGINQYEVCIYQHKISLRPLHGFYFFLSAILFRRCINVLLYGGYINAYNEEIQTGNILCCIALPLKQ